MAERINHAAQMPPIRVLHGGDLSGTRRQCLREHRVRIRHGQDHPNRPTAQRLRTEVVMLGRLISHPELRAVHGQPSHDRTVGSLHTVDLDRPECRLVELNSTGAVPYRQHRRDRTGDGSPLVPHLDRRCSLTKGKPNPLAFASTVVTRKTAAQRSSRVPVASAPATTRPATMPSRLNTVWRSVYVVMLRPRIIGAPFARRGLMYAG